MSNLEYIKKIRKAAYCIYNESEVNDALERMAKQMTDVLKEENPLFLVVLMGGMMPCTNLVLKLDFPLEIDYVHVSSFDLATNTVGKLQWHVKPRIELADRTVVIVDDILDSGITFQLLKQYCEDAKAKKVYTAAMLNKLVDRKPGGLKEADFTALTVGDEFVFGYGLDYSNYLRNLPGIYAIKPDDL